KRQSIGHPAQVDVQFCHKNGVPLWAIISSTFYWDTEGFYAGALVMVTDITPRKKAEDALRVSEAAEREQRLMAEALRDVAVTQVSTLNTEMIMARILEVIGRVVPHDTANIMLVENNHAHIASWHGLTDEEVAALEQLDLDV